MGGKLSTGSDNNSNAAGKFNSESCYDIGYINFEIDKNMLRPEKREKEKGDKSNSNPCNHVFCQFWGNKIMCKDCAPPYEILEEMFPDVYERELNWRSKLGAEDQSSAEDSVNRGVTLQFLVDFCNKYNLWSVPTREVTRDYVIPMTSKTRCRFVELPTMVQNNIVGPAKIFISHCWSGLFGDVVAAACDGRSDYLTRVWVDIFAVLQWPTTKNEFDFELVIRKCPYFMVVCSATTSDLKGLNDTELFSATTVLSESTREKIPFFRGWCIYELFYAFDCRDVTVIIKCGSNIPNYWESHRGHKFKDDDESIFRISVLIDINKADFTVPTDRAKIIGKVQGFPGGLDGLNMTVKGALGGAYFSGKFPLVHLYTSGDKEAYPLIIRDTQSHLQAIAAEGCITLLQEVLQKNPSLVHAKDRNGRTALMAAAAGGRQSCLELILSFGATLDEQDASGYTALHLAVIFCQYSTVEVLVSHGATVNAPREAGPLINSAGAPMSLGNGDTHYFGCDLEIPQLDGRVGSARRVPTPFLLSAMGGQLAIMKALANAGADMHAVDSENRTALLLSAMEGRRSCVEFLVKSGGVDVNSHDSRRRTALMEAASMSQTSCVEFLVTCGANVNAQDRDGRTALMETASMSSSRRRCALDEALSMSHISCVEFLVKSGANVNAQDSEGRTALMGAASLSHTSVSSCLVVLVMGGAHVNAQDSEGRTALMGAVSIGRYSSVEFLISSGARVNLRDYQGRTALMSGNLTSKVANLLISRGAWVHVWDKDGKSVTDIIRKHTPYDPNALLMMERRGPCSICTFYADSLWQGKFVERFCYEHNFVMTLPCCIPCYCILGCCFKCFLREVGNCCHEVCPLCFP